MANTGNPVVGASYPLYVIATATLAVNSNDTVIALLTGAATLNLPALASVRAGYQVYCRNNSAAPQTWTIQGNGSELIGASNTAAVTQGQALRIIADHVHTKWQILFGPA